MQTRIENRAAAGYMAKEKKPETDWTAILRRAATAGKKTILRHYDLQSRNKIVKRGVGGDLTLRIDEVSERAIYDSLKHDLGSRDSFTFLSEEIGEVEGASRLNEDPKPLVICDPLDGSHNAQVGIPFFSIALSVIKRPKTTDKEEDRTFGNIDAALILSIKTEDEYYGIKNYGAFHNGVEVKSTAGRSSLQIKTLLIETGDIDYLRDKIISRLTKKQVYKTRVLGSAALSYCMLADGSADAMIFAQPGGARTIDSPAGYLICKEAHCQFADLSSGRDQKRPVDSIEVGFGSRVNLLGARSSAILSRLRNRLGQLP